MKRINLQDIDWQKRFSHQKSLLFNEEDLQSKGSKIQIIKIETGGEIKPHFHKIRTEVFCVLKGNGVITLDNEEVQSNAFDFLLCKPNTTHAFKNTGNEAFVILVIRTNDTGDSDMLWVDEQR